MNPASNEEMIARALARRGWTLVVADWAMGWWAEGPQGQVVGGRDALDLEQAVRDATPTGLPTPAR